MLTKWQKSRWPFYIAINFLMLRPKNQMKFCWKNMYGNKMKSFGAKSGLYGRWHIKSMFWVLKNVVVWADVWELPLSWWRAICLQRLVFLISWKTTGKQIVVFHSELTVLRCSSGTIATCPVFPKKTGDHLLRSALCLKHLYSWLLFIFGLLDVNPRFITCHDVTDVFRSTAIVFLEHFFRRIDTSLFFSDWKIVWDPTRTNFFDSQMFMQYWMYAGPTNA